jgi:Ca2+/Na+ antiporter
MVALSLLLPLFGWTQLRVERWEGAVLLSLYVGFTAWLIAGVALGA